MKKLIVVLFIFLFMTDDVGSQIPNSKSRWYDQLPDCPCKNPDFNGIVLGDGWAKDKGDIAKYHTGAIASFRSYPPVKTKEGYSCQQCCYDKNGNLITSGRGTGTPDKKSACKRENKNGIMTIRLFGLMGHYLKDVKPWNKYMKKDSVSGWAKYNDLWKPNTGNNCRNNPVPN